MTGASRVSIPSMRIARSDAESPTGPGSSSARPADASGRRSDTHRADTGLCSAYTPPPGAGTPAGIARRMSGWVRPCRHSDSVNGLGVTTEVGAGSVSVFVRQAE